MNTSQGRLVGGPQDGGKIRTPGCDDPLPDVVYVGPRHMGDNYAAWSQEQSKRFPERYVVSERVVGPSSTWMHTPGGRA